MKIVITSSLTLTTKAFFVCLPSLYTLTLFLKDSQISPWEHTYASGIFHRKQIQKTKPINLYHTAKDKQSVYISFKIQHLKTVPETLQDLFLEGMENILQPNSSLLAHKNCKEKEKKCFYLLQEAPTVGCLVRDISSSSFNI